MNEKRLQKYLAIDHSKRDELRKYEQSISSGQALEALMIKPTSLDGKSICWPYLCGHYHGMLVDLIEMIGAQEIAALLDARENVRKKMEGNQIGLFMEEDK